MRLSAACCCLLQFLCYCPEFPRSAQASRTPMSKALTATPYNAVSTMTLTHRFFPRHSLRFDALGQAD